MRIIQQQMNSNLNKNTINYQSINSSQLYLNSNTADIYLNGTKKSSVAFFFPEFVNNINSIETRISIVNAQIPVSWYQLNTSNNTINMNNTNYTFPPGNYNFNSFATMWQTVFGNTWTLILNPLTNQITFNSDSYFQFSPSSMYSVLGFRQLDGGYMGMLAAYKYSLIAPYQCNFLGLTRIHIKSSTFHSNNMDTFTHSQTNILASVPVNASAGGMIQYVNFTQFQTVIKNNLVNTIQLDIQDDYGNFINFNNVDWTLTVQIDVLSEIVHSLDTLHAIYEKEAAVQE